MIKNLAKLKYWEIVALGVSSSVVAVLLLAFITRLLVGTWPQTNEAGYIAYMILGGGVSWAISGIAVEAITVKRRNAQVQQAMDNVMDLYAGYYIAGAGKHRAEEPYDQETDRG